MFGGPIGAIAGAAIGHLYDDDDTTPQNEQKARILYLAYFFPVLQKLQKQMGIFLKERFERWSHLSKDLGLMKKGQSLLKMFFEKQRQAVVQ